MIGVQIKAGLANQMFQYAFAYGLIKRGYDARVASRLRASEWDHEYIRCIEIFDLSQVRELPRYRLPARYTRSHLLQRLSRALPGKGGLKIPESVIYEENLKFEMDSPLDRRTYTPEQGSFMEGAWQSEQHFCGCKSEVKDLFSFPALEDSRNIELADFIGSHGNVVSVHVRKGHDYQISLGIGTCEPSYYREAIETIRSQREGCYFLLFSDNHAWCKEHLGDLIDQTVSWNPISGSGSHIDMQLMSLCRHHIIANSSYSWWAAWLSEEEGTIIIAPEKWLVTESDWSTDHIVPDRWIRL